MTYENQYSSGVVLASKGERTLTFFSADHLTTTNLYLRVFDVADAGDVDLETKDNQIGAFGIPRSDGSSIAGRDLSTQISFSRGLAYAITTTPDGDTAPASAVNLVLNYQ